MSPQAYSKQLSSIERPLCITNLSTHIITVGKSLIPYTIPIERGVGNPSWIKQAVLMANEPLRSWMTLLLENLWHSQKQRSLMNKEYVVDEIFGHEGTQKCMSYGVRWYGYTFRDNIYVPWTHIPGPFIIRQKTKCWTHQNSSVIIGFKEPNSFQKREVEM